MHATYKCSFVPVRSCLVHLPQELTRSLASRDVAAQDIVALLSFNGRTAYAGWSGHTATAASTLELDPGFAKNIGITESDPVAIELRVKPQEADVVWVEPQSADDWEVMELHASFLELNLLSQIRAVTTIHPLIVYLSANTTATVIVRKIEPALPEGEAFAKISPTAEVIVSPKSRDRATHKSRSAKINGAAARSTTSTKRSQKSPEAARMQPSICLRAVPPPLDSPAASTSGLVVFLHRDTLRSRLGMSKYLWADVLLPAALKPRTPTGDTIAPPADVASDKNKLELAQRIVVSAHADDTAQIDTVWISKAAQTALRTTTGAHIRLQPADRPQTKFSKLTFHELVRETPKQEVRLNAKLPASQRERYDELLHGLRGSPITHGLRLDGIAISLGKSGDWTIAEQTGKLSLAAGSPVVDVLEDEKAKIVRVRGVDKSLESLRKILRRSCSALLYGARGSGKTSVANFCADWAETNIGVHVVRADCKRLAEERITTIREAIEDWYGRCAWHAPSMLMLDDLDRLCPAEVEHTNSQRARQIAELFLAASRRARARHPIALLVTAQSRESLHSLLTTVHLFNDTIHLKSPVKAGRREILSSLLGDETTVDLLAVANMTEGYLPGDLELLTERAKHESLMRSMHDGSNGVISTDDYTRAMVGFTPASLRGVKLQKSSVAWSDIGGLTETRRILLETLEWPTRYAPIFANCPLRLRSGLLLYGYPGCGKTLLASAVASECGLNFISVKGPEILNKYIGASEKSVRDLFDRAQAAKPCVLFFDEFDSIAPKRGHDSTGVTDRVVNQMLTQMDGAEGLDGVYVLAATSRPDLIDPALLRPGRLDKSLLCDMPNADDRASILSALAGKMHLAQDISVEELAERTAGYTGADLQAMLYNAHLDAIHDALASTAVTEETDNRRDEHKKVVFRRFKLSAGGESLPKTLAERVSLETRVQAVIDAGSNTHSTSSTVKSDSPATNTARIAISWDNLDKSLKTTRPSISQQEYLRLQQVYRSFVDGRSAEGLPNGMPPVGEQRVTLG
ncbi:Peroxisome biosynthesis protein pex1 [Savitreella phatthalungensis]